MRNEDDDNRDIPELDLRRLRVMSALGRGAKGVVFLVKNESSDKEFMALKAISRASIENGKSGHDTDGSEYRRIFFEEEVLRRFNHPLFPRLRGTVFTDKIVGYAIDYCPGRDLSSLRKKQTEKMFSDDIIRFYAAELVLALEYLHGLGIVYRDLKPENVMIQESGHLMLVDFDLSKKLSAKSPETTPPTKSDPKVQKEKNRSYICSRFCNSGISPEDSVSPRVDSRSSESDSVEKSNSFVGTEEYVPPEVISGNGHDFAVDWWCLGIVLHEMLYGATPFRGSNRKETFYRILTKSPGLVGEATPLRDLIRKLLEKDPRRRIGLEEIKGHDFFSGVDWDLITQLPRPPYIPLEPEVDAVSGDREIDVENFVQQIFKIGDEDKVGTQKQDSRSKRSIDFVDGGGGGGGYYNGGVCVEGLNPLSPTDFSTLF